MAKNNFVKSANVDTEFDAHKLQELKKCATDPVYFVKTYCYIQHPTLGKIKFTLRPYQERILRAFVSNRLVLLMQPRQTGKCVLNKTYINICIKPIKIKKLFLFLFYNKVYKQLFNEKNIPKSK
jgi:superfamily II DNA or RNA helicase